jgi:uncharacterized membrane protein
MQAGKADPVVRRITAGDIVEALASGLRDFQRAPRFGLLLGGLSALFGIAIVAALYALGMPFLAYPLACGFALICPFVAAGLYEVSRRLESGEPLALGDVWRRVATRSEVRWMGFMTLFVLIMWMYQVRLLMAIFLGFTAMHATLGEFFQTVLTTSEGLMFLLIGNIVGAALATVLFSLSVISFPLVLDRDVDVVTAMVTSVRAVALNPAPMLLFAGLIALLMVVSVLPLFLGLLVTLPLLGHATWHLYKRAVAPEPAAAA